MVTAQSRGTRYDHTVIESKWQRRWADDGLHKVRDDDPRPKWYELTMYPYPSGDLHIGHWYVMAPSDAHARYRRMLGYNVLHPMGFDAFGLPAENAAIRRGVHPLRWTMNNIENMRRQLRTMGTVYDWDREVVTCDPDYYKWNQWLFLKFYEAGLAYRAYAPANWCPSCNTVLANEQVTSEGMCERCDTSVTHRDLNQWFFRITDYAEELLDMSGLEWPENIKTMQTNWIGRSEGVNIRFDISDHGLDQPFIDTFTTRIDTIYGVTFVVLAPEHPLTAQFTTPHCREAVEAYVEEARRQTEIERLSTDKDKTGVFTGSYCVNLLNGERVPIFVGDYVLMSYGTGIVMGVPAHDQRDYAFAQKHGLPIKVVVAPPDWDGEPLPEAYVDEGVQVASGDFDGLPSATARTRIAEFLEDKGWGERRVQYRMRDWLISRQRYWGAPIPVVYCETDGEVPVPYVQLPVLLPEDAEFKPTGESPLGFHRGFMEVECPQCGRPARRESDTMDTFVDSSWYQFRYLSPHYEAGPVDPAAAGLWGAVDQYTGGSEHAVMHLLYARFFTKAMRDLGEIGVDEPFARLFNQGQIVLGSRRMSKSRGNVVAPDEYVEESGADAVRCYMMFLGPWDQGGEWSDSGLNGVSRWLNRVWELASRDPDLLDVTIADRDAIRDLQRAVHQSIRKVTEDLERFKFNTSIAALMELTNHMNQVWERRSVDGEVWREAVGKLLLLMAPMAPHIAEELWEAMGRRYSVHQQAWPVWDESLAASDSITLVVQVNGRLRDRIEVDASIEEGRARELALSSVRVQPHIEGKEIVNIVYVPGRLVNVVAR